MTVISEAVCDVLIVDDDRSLNLALSKVLTAEGFQVVSVETGADALAGCRALDPSVVILDFELPDMSGQNVCRRLRTFSDVYVLMLSGRTSQEDTILSLALGADDYVTKPYSNGELVARLHGLLRRPRASTAHNSPERVFGPLRVNTNTREVTVNEIVVDLTRTEFEMLDYLTSNAGAVVGRASLLKQVWDTTWSNDDHLIDVHLHNLRRKLTAAGAPKNYLVTVRGVGFRFIAPTS